VVSSCLKKIAPLILALTGLVQARPGADLVVRGAPIYCVDGPRRWAQAMAVEQGKIVYVGSEAGVSAFRGEQTRELILTRGMVLPGFCDSHVHPLWAGLEARRCHLNDLTQVAEVQAAVQKYASQHPDKEWIVGSGWGLPLFAQANPSRQLLDSWVADRPVALESADGHSMWLNTRALEICGISASTRDPAGGRIERDPQGQPSGTLRENAIKLVQPKLPPVAPEERRQALQWGQSRLNQLGVTSWFEANAGPEDLAAYHDLEKTGQLQGRVSLAQTLSEVPPLLLNRERYSGTLAKATAVKIFLDGVLEARTAAVLEPYAGTSEKGDLMFEGPALTSLVNQLASAGFQVHIHAIGDRAVRTALDAFATAPGEDLRHTIAHLQLVHPSDIPRFRSLGVIPNVQAFWAQADEYVTRLTNPVLGPERAGRQYPLASLARSGAVMVAGSDWSVTTPNPLEAIEVALTRRAPNSQDPPWIPAERLDLPQMLAAYTLNGAYLGHREHETGSLEVGKFADFIVLDQNLFEIPPEKIHKANVTHTFLAGRAIWTAPQPGGP